jgi:hypothetical protein
MAEYTVLYYEIYECPKCPTDVGRILRTFKIKKNVEVTDNGKDDF